MTSHAPDRDERQSLAELALRFPGAARVFQDLELDYCCHGRTTLHDACIARGLDPTTVLATLRGAAPTTSTGERWDERPVPELVDHLLEGYHKRHRDELPRLVALADKVENVHRAAPDCPTGLAAHLRTMADDLERHMQKEEQILFPMLLAGHGLYAAGPIQVMEAEHLEHGENLAHLHRLAGGFRTPAHACATWRDLYRALADFERALMQHIHLENHVLFPRVLTQ